jgi:uncharacterized membrane protein YkoI
MRPVSSQLIALSALMVGACAEEQGKNYWVRHAPVTLPQAAEIAETNGPGRAVAAELAHSGKKAFYNIEIIDSVNHTRRLRVDAESGKIVKRND